MRMLMPSHAKKVQLWSEASQPLFAHYQVEAQLDAMMSPIVQLRSGGYLVINQAEALVAIDVNSGRSTRERNIEETALRTNLEAADEVARQLRLRDLAGLIVIDFIDMESKRHNAMVERRLKEALKNDRARIQVGHISHFGLLEMSRQRLRPSLAETNFVICPHCGGTGHVRSTESAAIHVLRGIEDEGSKRRAAEIIVHVATPIALYLLNHKRERLREIEARYAMRVIIAADDALISPRYRIERVRVQAAGEAVSHITPDMVQPAAALIEEAPRAAVPAVEEEAEAEAAEAVEPAEVPAEAGEEEEGEEIRAEGAETEEGEGRKRRRRRRRRGRREEEVSEEAAAEHEAPEPRAVEVAEVIEIAPAEAAPVAAEATEPAAEAAEPAEAAGEPAAEAEEETPARRRGRRGGRRRRRDGEGELASHALPGAEQPEVAPVYTGPTPANPFGGQAFDIFDVMEEAERQAELQRAAPAVETAPEAGPATIEAAVEANAAAEITAGSIAETEISARAETAGVETAGVETAGWARAATPALRLEAEPAAKAAPVTVLAKPEPTAAPTEPTPADEPAPAAAEAAPAPAAAEAARPTAEVVPLPVAEEKRPEPVVKPILVGVEDEAPAQKKRGWWRRS
jgi:ribonuclease E